MAEDSDLEKTELPTPRRLEKAREEGQVANSRELSTFIVLLAGGAGLWLMGSMLSGQMIQMVRSSFQLEPGFIGHPEWMVENLYDKATHILLVFLPFLGVMMLAAAASSLIMHGWMITTKPLQPNLGKLNPINGMKRMFSANSLIELSKAIAKSLIVGGVGVLVIWFNRDTVMSLVTEPVNVSIPHLGWLLWICFIVIMLGLLLLVAIDIPWQLWHHKKQLRMTKEEVRQEAKETEGDPKIKGRIRVMQREMARRRMMAEIPTADVVVTNPTHYSVALRYEEGRMRAPVVVAKGSHFLAARIKEIAQENNVPILEAPPLARALHEHAELGQTIPEALYMAVAEVLSYIYQLRRYSREGGHRPDEPVDLQVPPHLDPANAASSPP